MPQYKLSYSIETPLRATEDVPFTHGEFTVELGLAHPLDDEHLPATVIVEGRNWIEANAIAMEDGFGPVLDALSLHRKAPAMVQDLRSVVKEGTGTLRRAIVIESHKRARRNFRELILMRASGNGGENCAVLSCTGAEDLIPRCVRECRQQWTGSGPRSKKRSSRRLASAKPTQA